MRQRVLKWTVPGNSPRTSTTAARHSLEELRSSYSPTCTTKYDDEYSPRRWPENIPGSRFVVLSREFRRQPGWEGGREGGKKRAPAASSLEKKIDDAEEVKQAYAGTRAGTIAVAGSQVARKEGERGSS